MDKQERATVMSIDSQVRSLLVVVFAPIIGFLADNYSIAMTFLGLGIFILIMNRFLGNLDKENK